MRSQGATPRARPIVCAAILLVGALALSACGKAEKKPLADRADSAQRASVAPTGGGAASKPDLASILVTSSARMPDGRLNPRYSCAGADISPPLTWSGVSPANASEVVVLVRTLTRGSLQTNWVVAGIDPRIYHLSPGTLPAGAITGQNSLGGTRYSLCPPAQKPALVVLAVLALPHSLHLHAGFPLSAVEPLIGRPEIPWGSITITAGGR
jgi:phosphatidylethanolamine-binding protein (PEBP) family uncharacterized protein